MPGGDRVGGAGQGATGRLSLLHVIPLLLLGVGQAPVVVDVGPVRVVAWNGDETLATALAEYATSLGPWPGLPDLDLDPVRVIVTRSRARFDSVTGGRLPDWSGAVALPTTRTIVLLVRGDPRPALRHELAHLALHQVVRRVPLWFSEGYAAFAAGEWSRLDALELNWALVTGTAPDLAGLNRALRAGPTETRAAYALATTAVLLLHRLGGDRGLAPLIENVATEGAFEQGLRRTHLLTLAQFETLWRRDLRRRYGWLRLVTSFTLFWALVGVLVGVVWWRRRRRNRLRRAALDDGWVIPGQEGPSA